MVAQPESTGRSSGRGPEEAISGGYLRPLHRAMQDAELARPMSKTQASGAFLTEYCRASRASAAESRHRRSASDNPLGHYGSIILPSWPGVVVGGNPVYQPKCPVARPP